MSRAGRKRQQGLRTVSGRLSRAVAADDAHVEPIQVRMRMYGLTEDNARDQKAATVIGRLNLAGTITEAQYDAGVEYARLYQAYKRALKAPDALLDSQSAAGSQPETPAYATWCKTVIEKHELAVAAVTAANCLRENRGRNIFAALDYLVCRNEDHEHLRSDLIACLAALVAHFGLDARRSRSGGC